MSLMCSVLSRRACAVAALSLCGLAGSANAAMFTGSSGSLEATVDFNVNGTTLEVLLSNSSMNDVLAQASLLTGVFFQVSGAALSLTPTSAVVPAGSSVVFGTPDPGNVVGGEWAYESSLAGGPSGAGAYGISSSGLGLFGAANFPGNNLEGPVAVNGPQYGITSMGDNLATGNSTVTGGVGMIKHAVFFTLTGLPADFDLSRIHGVSFQYGTALDEPSFPGVPTPGAAALFGVAAMTGLRRRRA